MTIHFDEEKQEQKLHELKMEEEEDLAEQLSHKYSISYIDLNLTPLNIDALRIIPEAEAKEASIAPFNIVNKKVSVGVLSPKSEKTVEALKRLTERGFSVTPYMVSEESLKKVWARYKDLSYSFETKSGALDISNEEILNITKNVKTVDDIKKLIEQVLLEKKSYRISKVLEIMLAGAISLEASDVHLEPEEGYVRMRYRLDGVLNNVLDLDKDTYKLLISRIKLTSEMKLNVREKAQDGRFTINIADNEIEVRASVIPGGYGESAVLRVLNPNEIAVSLEDLGINQRLFDLIVHELKKPNGMILNTGPTGSGKTTTLYAFLKRIHTPGIKIITIENPIEYHLPGIVQTQTDDSKGYTFLEGLRSALRQDPDVIMVGEIRDSETAGVAVNSALTGHLVFSTLHTNDAAGTYPRLIDLGVNSKIITSAINLAMAQRLVRKLCDNCKKKQDLDQRSKEIIRKTLEGISDKSYLESVDPTNTYVPLGCDKCNTTGYKGRTGIYEAILSDEAIEQIVNENPSEREINRAAKHQNLLNMQEDGVIKVLKGVTSLDELERVVQLE